MKKLYGFLSFASFVGVLGVIGNIERDFVSPRKGMGQVALCLLLSVFFALLAGAFKGERYE